MGLVKNPFSSPSFGISIFCRNLRRKKRVSKEPENRAGRKGKGGISSEVPSSDSRSSYLWNLSKPGREIWTGKVSKFKTLCPPPRARGGGGDFCGNAPLNRRIPNHRKIDANKHSSVLFPLARECMCDGIRTVQRTLRRRIVKDRFWVAAVKPE